MRSFGITCLVLLLITLQASASQFVNTSINSFVTRIDKILTHHNELSSVLCPFNLHLGLSILHQGAKDETAKDMSSLLGLEGEKQEIAASYKSLLDQLTGEAFKTWTCMIPGENFNLSPRFVETSYKFFKAGSAGTSQLIGSADDDVTLKYCNNIGSRPKTTKLQLFSKAGFNSSWKKSFLPAEEEEFLLTSGEKVKVKMMHTKGYFAYKEDKNLDAKVVKIDYKEEGWSMVMVLPNNYKKGLTILQDKISEWPLENLLKYLNEMKMEVSIPKFNANAFNFHRDLKFLDKMGAKALFTNEADFSDVSIGSKMHLSHVLIEAFIAVNETGTLAGSGADFLAGGGDEIIYKTKNHQTNPTKPKPTNHTSANPEVDGLPQSNPSFKADHPFLFYIVGPGNVFLYNGKIVNPVSHKE
ncbi:leukocyte elastase inhibitor-like [Macrosteles quadrilineatus]|uniref:leukocyte elastase inhibitor-like n=1 Tax=Macrosteles quadrilineatus TaxID=74068 RepID=UPI0023E2407F|nr:leukocyte elastase inhibitor-like [Macrosteles quadrilineatus]